MEDRIGKQKNKRISDKQKGKQKDKRQRKRIRYRQERKMREKMTELIEDRRERMARQVRGQTAEEWDRREKTNIRKYKKRIEHEGYKTKTKEQRREQNKVQKQRGQRR